MKIMLGKNTSLSLLPLLVASVAATAIACQGAESLSSKQKMFVHVTDNYHTYLIPGLVATPRGTLLLVCDGRVRGSGDLGKIDRVRKRSPDSGKTLEKMRVLADDPGHESKIGNAAAVVDPATGAVHVIYCKDLVLFTHPTGPGRTHLTVQLSYDEGRTWPVSKVIEPGPAAYSDLAAGPGGTVYLAFGSGDTHTYQKIFVARFNLDWVTSPAMARVRA
jgi:hypothetical protein